MTLKIKLKETELSLKEISKLKLIKISKPPLSKLDVVSVRERIRIAKVRKRFSNPHLKKYYEIDGLPARDKEKLRPYHDKFQQVNSLPDYIKKMSTSFDVYFCTFAFKKSHPLDFYPRFFYYMRRKIDQILQQKSASIFILTPETKPMLHYHGFLFVPKPCADKFQQSCVSSSKIEYVEKMQEDKAAIYLKRAILTADSEAIKSAYAELKAAEAIERKFKSKIPDMNPVKFSRKLLTRFSLDHMRAIFERDKAENKHTAIRIFAKSKLQDYRIYKVEDCEQFFSSNFYSSKFFTSDRRFVSSDVIFESARNSQYL